MLSASLTCVCVCVCARARARAMLPCCTIRPANIPSTPHRAYKDAGWQGYGQFLGTGNTNTSKRVFAPFDQASILLTWIMLPCVLFGAKYIDLVALTTHHQPKIWIWDVCVFFGGGEGGGGGVWGPNQNTSRIKRTRITPICIHNVRYTNSGPPLFLFPIRFSGACVRTRAGAVLFQGVVGVEQGMVGTTGGLLPCHHGRRPALPVLEAVATMAGDLLSLS